RPAARPRLLQRRHPRGLRPGARLRARRRRPLRRAAEAVRARPAGGRLRALPGAGAPGADGGVAAGGGAIMSFEVAGLRQAKADGPLTLAVPRGALFGETLDILGAAGVDTAELRGDSRSLIFE